MDSKSDKAIFPGYSTNSRAYTFFNLETKVQMESIIVVDEEFFIEKKIDVEEDVGTSAQTIDALENMADIEFNIKSTKNTLFVKEGHVKIMMVYIDVEDNVLERMSKRMVQHLGKQLQSEPE